MMLYPHERRIVGGLATMSQQEIARAAGITLSSVKRRLDKISALLGDNTQLQLARKNKRGKTKVYGSLPPIEAEALSQVIDLPEDDGW